MKCVDLALVVGATEDGEWNSAGDAVVDCAMRFAGESEDAVHAVVPLLLSRRRHCRVEASFHRLHRWPIRWITQAGSMSGEEAGCRLWG